METKNMISIRLKELRKEKKITQKELSQLTGISLKSIINYENKVREPNSKAMAALESFFNVSGAFLRGETDQRNPIMKWEDKDIMDSIDESIQIIIENISNLISSQDEMIRERYYSLLVELQRIFKYDIKVQESFLDTLLKCIFAISRLIDVTLQINMTDQSNTINHYDIMLKKELKNIEKSLNSILSYVELKDS